MVKSIPTRCVMNGRLLSVCIVPTEAPGAPRCAYPNTASTTVAYAEATMEVKCFTLKLCLFFCKFFRIIFTLSTKRQGRVAVVPFVIPALLGHASLTPSPPRKGRLYVMVLLSEAPLGVDDIDAPMMSWTITTIFRRRLQVMASGKNKLKRRAWRTAYFALKGMRKEGNRKGMTRTLNGKQEQGIPPIVPGCPMPMATRYDFEVPLHRFIALL